MAEDSGIISQSIPSSVSAQAQQRKEARAQRTNSLEASETDGQAASDMATCGW